MEMKRGILKRPAVIIILIILLAGFAAAGFKTLYNPFTNRLDFFRDDNLTGNKVYLGEVDVKNNLTVHGYLAVKESLSNMSMSNMTYTNVTESTSYELNSTDILENTFKLYTMNSTVAGSGNLTLLSSGNYTLVSTEGRFSLNHNRFDSLNLTASFNRFYLPENLSVGDLLVDNNVLVNGQWINASNANMNLGGNISLGDRIRFRLLETIDNIVDGWLRLTANVNVTADLDVSGNATFRDEWVNISGNLNVDKNVSGSLAYFNYVNASKEMFGPQNWTDNQNYPACSPDGTAITCLGDSVTTSAFVRPTGENVTGDYTLWNGTVTFNGSQPKYLDTLFSYVNGTNAFTFNASYLEKNATTNLNMTGLNITDIADLFVDTIHGGSPINFANNVNFTYDGNAKNITNLNYLTADFLQGDGSGLTDLTAYNKSYMEINASTDQNMTNHTIWDIDRLYFHLGEYLDNLVDGWIKLTGSLFVTEELNVSGPTTLNDNVNITENNITNIGSLKFKLGEYIDNLVDGWLRVKGSLNVDNDFNADGNSTFTQYSGEMWNYTSNVTAWLFDIPATDVYYNLSNLTVGHLNGFRFQSNSSLSGGSYLVAEFAGWYDVDLAFSFGSTNVGLFSTSVARNFDQGLSRKCYSRDWVQNVARVNHAGVDCHLYLDAGDAVNIKLESETTPANDIWIHTVNLNLIRIGA